MGKTYKQLSLRAILFPLLLLPPAGVYAAPVAEIPALELDFLRAQSVLYSILPQNARWSLSVSSLHSSNRFDGGNSADTPLQCASLVKMLVSAALLDSHTMKPVRMDTIIYTDGKEADGVLGASLYMAGRGNAFLSEQDLNKAVLTLVENGIREITGDIVADDTYLDVGDYRSSWSGPAYTMPGALGLDLHTVAVGRESDVSSPFSSPSNSYVKITGINSGRHVIQHEDLRYELSPGVLRKRFPLSDPALFAAQTLRTLLESAGVTVRGEARKGATPDAVIELLRIEPSPLEMMISNTNMNSLNVMAENFLLVLGAQRYSAPGTYEKGLRALEDFFARMGLPSGTIHVADGSGLSEKNRVRSADMVEFLRFASTKPWFSDFYESLPRTGMEGTLKEFSFRDGNVRVKTGQTDRVYALAGYFIDSRGEPAVFALQVNVPGADMLFSVGSRILMILTGKTDLKGSSALSESTK